MIINDGFVPKRKASNRLPPGQYEEEDFPVLSIGPTPDVEFADWKLKVTGLVERPLSWNWEEFNKLKKEKVQKDIHCVTKWSKFDTNWEGVSLDVIAELTGVLDIAT